MKKETVCFVFGKVTFDPVKLKDLEKVKCRCGGTLKIAGKGEADYASIKTWRLQCRKCKGNYFARILASRSERACFEKPRNRRKT